MSSRSSPHGEVVAVTASGVNDDKVLRNADVGLTMVTITIAIQLWFVSYRNAKSNLMSCSDMRHLPSYACLYYGSIPDSSPVVSLVSFVGNRKTPRMLGRKKARKRNVSRLSSFPSPLALPSAALNINRR